MNAFETDRENIRIFSKALRLCDGDMAAAMILVTKWGRDGFEPTWDEVNAIKETKQ